MAFQRIFRPLPLPNSASAALLLVRLIVGLAFIFHGWGKIQTPFSWMPPGGPMAIPGPFQFLAALSEFGGGIALLLGLLTRLGMLGLAFTMAVATYFHAVVMGDPFTSSTAGGMSYEPALGYFGIAVLFLIMGPGKFSLDALIFGREPKFSAPM